MIAGTLEIQLLANIARLQRDMNAAGNTVSRATAGMERAANAAKVALGSIGLGIGLGQLVPLIDKYVKYTAQLKLATESTVEYSRALSSVRAISKEAQSDISSTGVLYARIANATRELGISQQKIVDVTRVVSLGLKVSGATASESASAMLQLSQAFGSGVLRGEEFNAVNEAAPRIMKALADGMGVPIGQLRKMASEGKITSDVMVNSLVKSLKQIEGEAKGIQTISGAFQELKNNVLEFVGAGADTSGTIKTITSGIGLLADNMKLLTGIILTLTAVKFANWLAAGTTALTASVLANRAAAAAALLTAKADAEAAAASVALTAARVAELRAAVIAAQGNVALAITTNGLIPAQARATAAATAHTASLVALTVAQRAASTTASMATGALALLRGPVGAVVTVLGLAATAWWAFGNAAEDANEQATNSTLTGSDAIIAALDQQAKKLRERIALAEAGQTQAAKAGGPGASALTAMLNNMEVLEKAKAGLTGDALATIDKMIDGIRQKFDALSKSINTVSELTKQVEDIGKKSKVAEWAEKYATKAEKLAAELKKARDELGRFFTPQLESRIRDKFKDKDVKDKISDYVKLTQEVAKLTAEERRRAALGRDLTAGEKRLVDLIAERTAGTKKMSEGEFKLAKSHLAALDALERLNTANEKLKNARLEISKISKSADTAAQDRTERLELENKLVGLSVVQQQLLRNEYESNLTLKRQLKSLDEAAKGIQDPAQIAKLKAASAARIQAIKDEHKAQIEARYRSNLNGSVESFLDPAINEKLGREFVNGEIARQQELAKQEHAAALSKIADLDVINARINIEKELQANLAKAKADSLDVELARSAGLSVMADEAADKIAKFREQEDQYGATVAQHTEAVMAISRDTALAEARGLEMRREQFAAREQYYKAEAEAAKKALGVSANQALYDQAGVDLQQKLFDITLKYSTAEELINLGKEKRLKLHEQTLLSILKEKNAALAGVGAGEDLVKIKAEQLRLEKELANLSVATAAKEEAEAKARQRRLRDEWFIRDTAQRNIISDFAANFESDIRTSMLRILETGTGTISAYFKAFRNAFRTNVSNFIAKEFAKPYIMKVVMSLAGVLGLDSLAAAAGVQANAGAFTGDKVSSTSWLDAGTSLWKGLQGGFETFGSGITSALDSLGGRLLFSENSLLSKVGEGLLNSSNAIGTAASYMGAAMAGVAIGSFIGGDKKVIGLDSTTTSAIGAAIGAAVGGPVGAFVGGIAGGAINAVFGRGPKKYGDTTVRGGFSGAGFEGNLVTPWHKKGGLLSKGKSGEDTQDLTDPAQQFLDSMVGKSGLAFERLIAISGDAARSVDGWSFAINRALLTEEDFKNLFGDLADSMGTFVIPELEKFKQEGENLADTAVRLGDEYIIAQGIFDMLGHSAYETGIASLGMRDSLIQMLGGIQSASSSMEIFYKNFFTEDEQYANSLKQVNEALSLLGDTVPTTRAEFRALVESLDLTTEAGQRQFAGYMALVPAFANVTKPVEELTQSLEELADASMDALSAIATQLDKLRGNTAASEIIAQMNMASSMDALTLAAPWIKSFEQLSTITVEDAKNYSLANKKLILNALTAGAALKAFADEAEAQRKRAAIAALEAVKNAATAERANVLKTSQPVIDRVSESIAKLSGLADALKQAVDEINPMSRADAQAQIAAMLLIAKTSGVLPTKDSISGALQSISKPSENMFRTFIEWKTDQIKTARDLADLGKITGNQLSVEERTLAAWQAWQDSELSRLDSIIDYAQQQIDALNGIASSLTTGLGAVAGSMDGIQNVLAAQMGGTVAGLGIADVNGMLVFTGQAGDHTPTPPTQATFDDLVNRRRAIRGFASGGHHSGGLRVVGENGPELEYTGPSRITSNSDSKKLLDTRQLEALIDRLIDTVKAGDIAIAKNTGDTAKYAKRWDGNGILVRAETTAPLPVRQTA